MGKEITIYDIARELNISAATVSRGLKNSSAVSKPTIKKILEKAGEMGYRHNTFASNLRKQKSYTIGILLHTLNSNFIASVLAGIEKITAEAGYNIIIVHSRENYEQEVENAMNLFHNRVDGVIASLSFSSKNIDHFQPFFEKNIPVIFFDRVEESSNKTHVIIDNYKSGYIATQHLLQQGCSRIVHFTSSLKRNVYHQRHRGYTDALFDAGIPYNKDLVLVKDISEESALEAAHEILQMEPRPDGLFVSNDFEAAVCMQELKRHGMQVPDDIAVVGFNNDAISKIVDPQLTTIDYPGKEMGEVTARNIVNHLNGRGNIASTNRIIIRSELIVRESSVKNRQKK
ncbi:LacI family DNA-binding transcriptional regulator [Ferruginibacter sp. HRS2-29]|uniref:LacI family DNA-binding transcriptional regulator n=1 Tax=Ferruginibacter sp. HRS2-29 TaxID=2487334 RepID=UPI0020CD4685|nr:LacI family DNA-binding transcriptional regulator [Ferruginibacter sp. HRS2-29]MCP9753493.1 LacI family transcriptional regulator [Ferruginibacter sp. HRS2-29]